MTSAVKRISTIAFHLAALLPRNATLGSLGEKKRVRMTLPPPPDDDLDRLVADHLGRQAARLDVGPRRDRIRATVKHNPPADAGGGRWRRLTAWALPVAVAAGV